MKAISLAVMLFVVSFTAIAEQSIPSLYIEIALDNKVPPKLFFALILNESRSVTENRNGRRVLPWPWTLNHKGRPHYFQTRRQAFAFVSRLVEDGDDNFDVGLGQLNWKWHKGKFNNDAWLAFDPVFNLSVAARFFRKQFDRPECSSWVKAVGCYHRPGQRVRDKEIAKLYSDKVVTLWAKI